MSAPRLDGSSEHDRDWLAWAVAEEHHANERESGDRFVVQHCAEGVLIAAVDGAGHGPEAAVAAQIAADTLAANAAEPPIALLLRCHEQLKGTRGAVMTVAFVHRRDRTLTWLGVGNVEAALFRDDGAATTPERALLRNGVLGYLLPPVRAEVLPLKPLDTLIIVTDGIQPTFADELPPGHDVQAVADGILARHQNPNDDALVVVARYLEGAC